MAAPASADDYLAELVSKARAQKLADERPWRILLHYRQGWFSGESLVDDPRFFTSPIGKRDPAAELEATLASFFTPQEPGVEHPRSRFTARYHWLKERLQIDESRLPPIDQSALNEYMQRVSPKRAVLVFPTAHMNSPASMFGHTLLRLDGGYDNELLAHAVNYSAFTTSSGGLLYAVKGIFGGYRGYFSLLPYYEKVKEYNDLERRDIWEYPLSLTPEESERLALHVWELKDIYSDYYFFDENCSYNLLFLLEAARPTLRLTEQFHVYVLPVETIRVMGDAGILADSHYRPSLATRMIFHASHLSKEAFVASQQIAEGTREPGSISATLEPAESAAALDLSAELVQFRYYRGELELDPYRKQLLSILNVRSTLGKHPSPEPPTPIAPEKGHRSGRLSLAGGISDKKAFTEVVWRPAYHDLLDPPAGYSPWGEIRFMESALRLVPEDNRLILHRFRPVEIVSLSPWNRLFSPISWKINGGLSRHLMRNGKEESVADLRGGGGVTLPLGEHAVTYLLADGGVLAGDRLQDNFAIGCGGSGGVLIDTGSWGRLQVAGGGLTYLLPDNFTDWQISAEENIRLSKDRSLSLAVSHRREFGHDLQEAKLSLHLYW
jgi:hypothetical protein